jgi:hypothetical protein
LLGLILSLLLRNPSLLFVVLALLFLCAPLLKALLLLTLLCGLPLLFGSLSLLLVLRLARVVPALGFSLLALLIVLPATTAATAFVLRLSGLRLSGLLIPLLPFCSLPLPVFAVLRLLGVREATRAWQNDHTHNRGQREATKVNTFHDFLQKNRAEGKVVSPPLIAIAIPMTASYRNTSQIRLPNAIWFRDEPYQALVRVGLGEPLSADDRAFINDRVSQ